MFLLSAKDFMQAYKRLAYIDQVSKFRKRQAKEIVSKKELLIKLNDSIIYKKQIKDSLISILEKEQKIIDKEKEKEEKLLSKIKKKERKYLNQIVAKQNKEKEYEDRLKKKIINIVNRRPGGKSKKFALTKEAKSLSSSFLKNKGKLPAPVLKGYVTRYFGKRKHEVMRKISIKSSGWYYATAKKSIARAVFNGVVTAIMVDEKTKVKTVIIQHGNYMTVYSNLEKLLVKEGDKIETKQKLGTVHTNTTTDKTILKFALWKDSKPQNPSAWMYQGK